MKPGVGMGTPDRVNTQLKKDARPSIFNKVISKDEESPKNGTKEKVSKVNKGL